MPIKIIMLDNVFLEENSCSNPQLISFKDLKAHSLFYVCVLVIPFLLLASPKEWKLIMTGITYIYVKTIISMNLDNLQPRKIFVLNKKMMKVQGSSWVISIWVEQPFYDMLQHAYCLAVQKITNWVSTQTYCIGKTHSFYRYGMQE